MKLTSFISSVALLLTIIIAAPGVVANKNIFCYYSSFAQNRPGRGQFLPEDISPFLCTHIVFAFVDIDTDSLDLKPYNYNDQGYNGLYARTIALKQKNPSLKILLAVGGWQMGSDAFVPVVRTSRSRRAFTKNVIRYLRRYSFDGFDMDWEFPGTRGSSPDDKYRFTLLMKELYEGFEEESRDTGKEKLLLTLATASGTYYISQAYEPSEVVKYVDYLLLMTYNYHGWWEKQTGHHSGLWAHSGDDGDKKQLNQNWSIDFWLDAGISKDRLIVGIPTYGMSFRLEDPSDNGVFASASGGGDKGYYTGETGIMSYYEVCENAQEHGWQAKWIEDQAVPYAYGDGQWVGFDSQESIELKAENIIKRDLGGAFVWSLEMDDFTGYCGEGEYPLLSVITQTLKPYDGAMAETHMDPVIQEQVKAHPAARTPVTDAQPVYTEPAHSREESEEEEWKSSSEEEKWKSSSEEEKPDWETFDDNEGVHDDKVVECDGLGIQPDYDHCEGFYVCLPDSTLGFYTGHFMKCPDGTLFDKELKICNHRHNVNC